MSVKNDNKGFLGEKLGGYRVDPPESVWKNIAARISGGNRRTVILISLATAATLALAITLGIHYFGPDTSADGPLSEAGEETVRVERQQEAVSPEIPGAAERREEVASREPAEVKPPGESRLRDRVMDAMEEQRDQPGDRAPMVPEEIIAGEEVALAETVEGTVPDSADAGYQEPLLQEAQPRVEGGMPVEQESNPVEVAEIGEIPVSEPVKISGLDHEERKKWTLGAVISPLYSFRDAQTEVLKAGTDVESGMLAYAGGVQVSYRAAGRLSIESGLLYNKMGVNIGASGVNLLSRSADPASIDGGTYGTSDLVAVTNSVGNIVSNSGDIFINEYKMIVTAPESGAFHDNTTMEVTSAEEGIQQQLEYLELPFNVRYTVVDRTLELQLIGGLSTNFLVNNSVTMDTPSGPEEIGYLSNIRNVNYSGNAGVGMIYHIHDRFSLRLEPRFRYFLNSVNDETLPSTRPYSLGFYTGLNYTF